MVYICFCCTAFENDRKSLIQQVKGATFIFWVDKSSWKSQNWLILAGFENLKLVVKQCYQTGQFLIGQRLKENANIEKI